MEVLMSAGDVSGDGTPVTPLETLDSLRTALLTLESERRRLAGVLGAIEGELANLDLRIAGTGDRLEPHRRAYSAQVAFLRHMAGVPGGAIIAMPASALDIHRTFIVATTLSARLDRHLAAVTGGVAELSTLGKEREQRETRRRDILAGMFAITGDIESANGQARDLLAPLRSAGAGAPIAAALRAMDIEAWKGRLLAPAPGDASGEDGLQIRTAPGETVVTPFDGVVVHAGTASDRGRQLVIDHGKGYRTLLQGYAYDDVEAGEVLLAGQPVAVMASDDTLPQTLYVELQHAGTPVNLRLWLISGTSEEGDP